MSLVVDLRTRFPARQDILPVFAVIAVVVYSWTLYRLAYFIPGWLKAMTLGESLAVAAYGFVFDLFESLLILLALLCLAFILPARLFREKFTSQSVIIVLVMAVAAITLQDNIAIFYDSQPDQFRYALLGALLFFVVLWLLSFILAHRIGAFDRWLRSLADRAIVFLYLYVPLSIIGLLVVFVRNL